MSSVSEDFISVITGLPYNLYLCGFDKSAVSTYTHQLIQIIFFSGRFYCYTETPDEVSLILEESSLSLFPQSAFDNGHLKLASKTPWKAIQLTLSASPLTTGIIHAISTPLGQAGISIIYYSTFNNDYILVESSNYQKARDCLKKRFPLLWSDAEELEPSTLQQQQTTLGLNHTQLHISENFPDTPISKSPPDTELRNVDTQKFKQLQSLPSLSVALARIPVDVLDNSARALIQLIFYPKSSFRFISITRAEEEEISVMIDQNTLSAFPREKLFLVLDDLWIPVRRLHKSGFQETGVVARLTTPLTSVSILYLSCYKTSYILVRKSDFESAVEKWRVHDFVISPAVSPLPPPGQQQTQQQH